MRPSRGDCFATTATPRRETGWRIGHFERKPPRGYARSLESGENEIANPVIYRLYDQIRLATRGPLLSFERARAILQLNLRPRWPECADPPCRQYQVWLAAPETYSPLFSLAGGGLDQLTRNGSRVRIEGWVPFADDERGQLLRLYVPVTPAQSRIENVHRADVAENLSSSSRRFGFRLVLTYADEDEAERVGEAVCIAARSEETDFFVLHGGNEVCRKLLVP